jgi:type II secretory pathway component PulF
MPSFRYTSRDATGAVAAGTFAASGIDALAAELRSRGHLLVDFEEVKPSTRGDLTWNPRTWLRPGTLDVSMGCLQLATMLRSGLSLLSSLRTVAEQSSKPRMGTVWSRVASGIERGSSFADALEAESGTIPNHVIQLARVGETTGSLDAALSRAAEHLERRRQLKLTVFNALAYPFIVTLLALGVAGFLVVFVIPKISKYLSGAGRNLPEITRKLMEFSSFLQSWLPQLLILVIASLVGLALVRRWPPGRLATDRLMLRVPLVGGVLRLAGTATLARGLGVLLESGVTLLESLSASANLLENHALRERVRLAREAVLRGGRLAPALEQDRRFMPMLPRMVAVGENAGTLVQTLNEVASFHENQLLVVIRRMSVLVEPVVILVVGSIVGFVYIAFFAALFSIAGGVR